MNKVINIGEDEQFMSHSVLNEDRCLAFAPNVDGLPDKSNMVVLKFKNLEAAEKVLERLKGLVIEWHLDNLLAEV